MVVDPNQTPTELKQPYMVDVTGDWRVGSKVGRTVYIDDQLVGVMDTPELAAFVVRAVLLMQMQSTGSRIRPVVNPEGPLPRVQ